MTVGMGVKAYMYKGGVDFSAASHQQRMQQGNVYWGYGKSYIVVVPDTEY